MATKALGMEVLHRIDPVGATAGATFSRVEAIYREHGDTVARWALRLGGPRVDAEDAVQEVFAVVAERLSGFRGDSKLTTWLYGITENVVREHRRRESVAWWFARKTDGREPGQPFGPSAPEVIAQREATDLLYRALDRMREPYRTALILFELEEMSGEQIAQLKGVRPATVWVWLHRARAQLARELAKLARGE